MFLNQLIHINSEHVVVSAAPSAFYFYSSPVNLESSVESGGRGGTIETVKTKCDWNSVWELKAPRIFPFFQMNWMGKLFRVQHVANNIILIFISKNVFLNIHCRRLTDGSLRNFPCNSPSLIPLPLDSLKYSTIVFVWIEWISYFDWQILVCCWCCMRQQDSFYHLFSLFFARHVIYEWI